MLASRPTGALMDQGTSKLTLFTARFLTATTATREALAVGAAALLSLVVHAHYRVTGLGESDAARFARIAFAWHVRGRLSFDEVGYQIRTSCLYLRLERLALDHGLPLHSLPSLVNWMSIVLGTACSVALYFLFRRVTSRPVAAVATVVYALTPGFWLGNIYGMPTVPGMFFLIVALIFFLDATREQGQSALFFGRVLLAWLSMSLALAFKSDLVLCGGAFLGAALAQHKRRWFLVGCSAVVVVGGTAASLGFARLVVAPSSSASSATSTGEGGVSFLKSWNETFGVSLDALLTDSNNTVISRCVGGLLFGVIVLALCWGLAVGGARRKQAVLALLWGLPPILAWGVRFGNSARHNVPAFPPLILFTTLFLFEIVKHDLRRATALVAAVMCVSYFSNTSGDAALKPQSNLIALSEAMAKFTTGIHRKARAEAETPGLKRVVIAGYADAYTEFELMSDANRPSVDIGDTWVIQDGDRTTVIDYSAYLKKKSARELARRYRAKGFEVLSISYGL